MKKERKELRSLLQVIIGIFPCGDSDERGGELDC